MPVTVPLRLVLLVTALVAAVALLFVVVGRPGQGLAELPLRDFVEYWAAGRLIAQGDNPYDPDLVHELERQAGREEDGILMWNPPWVLPWVLPFGLMPVRTAHLVWILSQLAVLAFCADWLWRSYGGPATHRLAAIVLALAFVPSLSAVLVGQISPLLLLGAVAFLAAQRARRDFLAGAATTLLAVKPHLAWLFWLALLLWCVRTRRYRVLAGGLAAGAALTAIALAFNPAVLAQYWHTFTSHPPAQYSSPTVGTLLRMTVGDVFGLQFAVLGPGLLWFAWYWRRYASTWDWHERMPLLLLVSMLTAAYGAWLFDLVVLLVPVLAVAANLADSGGRLRRAAALTAYALINGAALTQMLVPAEMQYLYYMWMTPALLAAYLALRPITPPAELALAP